LGFVVDNFTLTRIDLLFDNLILASYLSVALLGIIGYNMYESKTAGRRILEPFVRALPLFVQFAFGGLFSGFAIFYTRSASLAASWPFLLILAALLFGNEFFRKYYLRFSFQASIFFFALFSYLIFFVPIVAGEIGPHIFVLSGILSILIIAIILYVLSGVIEQRIKETKNVLTASIGGIFIAINILYFANIIPPIPLSLKEAGVYHSVEKMPNGGYMVTKEKKDWNDFLHIYDEIHVFSGDPVYVLSSVFAPTDLNTQIYHEWQYYDEVKGEWITASRIGFPITGGKDAGYRGYSVKSNIFHGNWRVDITTEKGQLVGRVKFKIIDAETPPGIEADII